MLSFFPKSESTSARLKIILQIDINEFTKGKLATAKFFVLNFLRFSFFHFLEQRYYMYMLSEH